MGRVLRLRGADVIPFGTYQPDGNLVRLPSAYCFAEYEDKSTNQRPVEATLKEIAVAPIGLT